MSAAEALVGRELAGYQIEALIGRGGMGVCYRAHDPELARRVAIKVIAPELADDPVFRERFLEEMKVIASVEHPHVCPVYRAGEAESGELFICLRYLEGDDMGKVIARVGALSPGRALQILEQVASALDYMHARSICHRDVKPENVLLDAGGNAYLTDFGLAGAVWEGNEQALMAGTLAYLAPERIDGQEASSASDLYALGCIAYAFLTGRPPFDKELDAAILYAHMSEEPPSLEERELARIDPVLAQALAKNPAERQSSCSDFVDELARVFDQPEPIADWPEGLPHPATRFFGRARERRELQGVLANPETRLLTLTGPGGTGKTRLALQAAAESQQHFPDGVRWLSLAPLGDPSLFLSLLAQVLEVLELPGVTLEDSVKEVLAQKRLLLCLDNTEHLLPAIADDIAFLRSVEGPTFLVTSRERLDLQAEQVYPVSPLLEDEGVALFNDRARFLNPNLDTGDPAIATLCERLDSLPLAIELAAARSDVYSPTELLSLIGTQLDVLQGQRDHDPRHRTLASTIEWSYELLSDDERRVFLAISVFAGGCTEAAAAAVSEASREDLLSLASKSLLRKRDGVSGQRYWMLETIRQYAASRLSDDEARELLEAAARFMTPRLIEIGDQAEMGESPEWREQMYEEQANVQSLVRSARELGLDEPALELASAAGFPLREAARLREGYELLSIALKDSTASDGLRARALDGASTLANHMGEHSTALELGREALELCEKIGDDDRKIRVLGNLGAASSEAGNFDRAQQYLIAQADLARALGVEVELARSSYNLGLVELRRGEPQLALEPLETAREIVRRVGNTPGAIYCETSLARVRSELGEPREACALFESSLRMIRDTGYEVQAANVVEELAIIAVDIEQMEIGARLIATADRLRELDGSRISEVEAERVAYVREALGLDSSQGHASYTLDECVEIAHRVATLVPS